MAKLANVQGVVDDDNDYCLMCNAKINENTEDWGLIYPTNSNCQPRYLCKECGDFLWSLRYSVHTGLYVVTSSQ